MTLVLMTGLPGTGKSTIATAAARALPAAPLSADPIEAALSASGMSAEQRPDKAAYEVLKAHTQEHLAAGLAVVVDAVNPFDFVRQAFVDLAKSHAAPVVVLATACADAALHRRRVEVRHEAGLKQADWAEVLRQAAYYEPFAGEALTLDAAGPLDANLEAGRRRLATPATYTGRMHGYEPPKSSNEGSWGEIAFLTVAALKIILIPLGLVIIVVALVVTTLMGLFGNPVEAILPGVLLVALVGYLVWRQKRADDDAVVRREADLR